MDEIYKKDRWENTIVFFPRVAGDLRLVNLNLWEKEVGNCMERTETGIRHVGITRFGHHDKANTMPKLRCHSENVSSPVKRANDHFIKTKVSRYE